MREWIGMPASGNELGRTSVAIGTFDGFHVGHLAVVDAAIRDAAQHGTSATVFTFDRHPIEVIAPDRHPGYVSTPSERRAILSGLAIDHLVVARFDEELRDTPAERFIEEILLGSLGAEAVIVGDTFRFGRRHSGSVQTLVEMGKRLGFRTIPVPAVMVGNRIASSTRIRHLLVAGNVAEAGQVLGRPYRLQGTVVKGNQIGRTLGYPTANLAPTCNQVIPADGIYAVIASTSHGDFPGACSIGTRPTLGALPRAIETYLIGFDQDIYGQELALSFVERIRDQRRFEDLDSLVSQISDDVSAITRRLGSHSRP